MDNSTPETSFEQWLSPVNTPLFQSLVAAHQSDYYIKKLTTESFLKLLLYAQLNEVESTRVLSDCVWDERLQAGIHLEFISHSQLSRRLGQMDTDIFQRLFLDLVIQIQNGQTHRPAMPLKVIDSSTLPLNITRHQWAAFRKTKAGVKLHLRLVFMDKGISYPEKAIITPAKVHDRNQLEVLVDDSKCMYVFDRGYLDYERFD